MNMGIAIVGVIFAIFIVFRAVPNMLLCNSHKELREYYENKIKRIDHLTDKYDPDTLNRVWQFTRVIWVIVFFMVLYSIVIGAVNL